MFMDKLSSIYIYIYEIDQKYNYYYVNVLYNNSIIENHVTYLILLYNV